MPPPVGRCHGRTGQQKLVAAGRVVILIDAAVFEVEGNAIVSSVMIGGDHQRGVGADDSFGAGAAAAVIIGVIRYRYASPGQSVSHASDHAFDVGGSARGNDRYLQDCSR